MSQPKQGFAGLLSHKTTFFMKKLYLALALIFPVLCHAQTLKFPTNQKSLFIEDGIYTCDPCWTWAKPMIDSMQHVYDSNFIYYIQERGAGTTELCTMTASWLFSSMFSMPFGYTMYSPYMFSNQMFIDNTVPNDSVFVANLRHNIDSVLAQPAVASPIFEVIEIGTDSMIVVTKTKFLQNATGDYHIGILLLQDSIYHYQAGAGNIYHMRQLTGPEYTWDISGNLVWDGNDSLHYTLRNGFIEEGTIFDDTFHYKLRSTQVLKNMKPLAVVWKYETTPLWDYSTSAYVPIEKYNYVNANDKPGFEYEDTTTAIHFSGVTSAGAALYPNPASTTVQVKLAGTNGSAMLHVYDLMGRMLMNKEVSNNEQVNISDLATGNYLYTISINGRITEKNKLTITR